MDWAFPHVPKPTFPLAALLLTSFLGLARAQKTATPQTMFNSAVSDYNAGRLAEAASELEVLERQAPSTAEVEELLGLVLSAESDSHSAYAHLLAAVRLKPNWAAARVNLAVDLSKLGESARAEAELKRAVAIDPADSEALQDLGQSYLEQGKISEAISPLEKAQKLQPSYQNGYNLALAYAQTNRPADAKREIEELLKTTDTAALHNLLAETDERLADYVSAATEYQRAAEMDPSESNLFDWGTELLVHYTPDLAIEIFSQGIKRYPHSARLHVGLGLAYYWRGSYDDAVKALLAGANLAPSDPRPYYFLAKAYGRSPSQAQAVTDCFRRFAELRPRDGKAQFYYAMSLWNGNDGSRAVTSRIELLLKRAIALDPSLSDAYFQLGNFYSGQKRFAEAVAEYQEAIKLDPSLPTAYYRLGQAYVHLGRKDLAQTEFQLHQRLYDRHLAEVDKQRAEIRQFVYSLKTGPAAAIPGAIPSKTPQGVAKSGGVSSSGNRR